MKKKIFSLFIPDNSEFTLNISSGLRRNIIEMYNSNDERFSRKKKY